LSRKVVFVLIALQALTLAAVVYPIWEGRQTTAAREAAAAQAGERGAALEASGRFAAARLAYDRAASLTPDASVALGWSDAARRAHALAIVAATAPPATDTLADTRDLAAALEASGDDAARKAGVALAMAAFRAEGNATAAIEAAREAADAGLASPWSDWQRGLALFETGQNTDAATAFEAVVKALPDHAAGWHRLGLAYVIHDRNDGAVEALQRALRLGAPPDAALDLARLFLKREMWAEATPHLESVLTARGDDPDVLRLLAAAQYGLKRFRVAAEVYQRAWRAAPEPRTLLSAAIALHAGGGLTEALALVDRIGADAAAIPEIAFERARLLLDLGRPDEGHAALRQYVALAGERPEERERVALARAQLGK
jgi:tetratricopeptide (TPR) repeat protein